MARKSPRIGGWGADRGTIYVYEQFLTNIHINNFDIEVELLTRTTEFMSFLEGLSQV